MARLIGTAGHVDHGKTSLIKALTGIDADRLPEEKSRGLTIDVGFAHIDFPEIGRVSIVDVPGHERFVTNMLVGALGIDVALLCVAADESVMPQTREHLLILDLLPVQSLVIAMTRADLADADVRELAAHDIRELLAGSRFPDAPIVPVSVMTGEGIPALREELRARLSEPQPEPEGPWYLPVDRVFTVKGHGTVVTGTLMAGRAKEGESAVVEPLGLVARVRQIQRHDAGADASEKGQRTAINLGGIKHEEIRRGVVVGTPGYVQATTSFDARLRWVLEPKHGKRVRVSIGADEVIGKLFLNDNDPDLAQVKLERPCAAVVGQPVVLRQYSPPVVMAGGRVTVPVALPRRKGTQVTAAQEASLADQMVSIVADAADGVLTDEVLRGVGRSGSGIASEFESLKASGRLLSFAGLWFTPESFDRASDRFLEALSRLHGAHPNRAYLPREAAVKEAKLAWSDKPLDRIVAHLASSGKVRSSGSTVALSTFHVALEPKQRAFLDRVIAALDAGGFSPPPPREIASGLGVPSQAVEGVLKLGIDAGEIVRLDDQVFMTPAQVARAWSVARERLAGNPFTAAEFKEALGTSRKYAIPLLELADARGKTARRGDLRVFT